MLTWNEFEAVAQATVGRRWKTSVARRLRRSPSTLRRWEERGYVPESSEGEVRHLLGLPIPRSQSDLIAEALIKALNIKMIG